MSGRTELFTKSFTAAGDINPFRFVAIGAGDNTIIQAASPTAAIIGICNIPIGYEDPIKYGQAAPAILKRSGDVIDVVMLGIFPVEFGAAVATPGTLVTADAQGRAVAAGGTPAAGTFLARTIEAAASGAIRNVILFGGIV